MTAPARPAARPALHRTTRTAVAVGGGLLSLAALAGCAPTPSGGATTEPADGASSAAATPADSGSPASSSASTAASGLKDGSYTATGDYTSPGGAAEIEVTVTLAGGTISKVQVVPKAQDATARQYEAQFASGIGAVAVGKPIAGLRVGAVSGSSLTGQGFEKALAAIRSEAAA
ncbi:hypothetical protein [uncultured Amnibacterium sp.]|uniref:hypothetical protein n=1 Tax=uncultured Amnibacterium sp. TaxID=1631851 RepID=UPI0035CA1CEE